MINTSGLEPRGRAVLVEMAKVERPKSAIHIPELVREKADMVEQQARVIALGPHCWHDEPGPRAAVGDLILITKFAGFQTRGPADGKLYRFINDRDIFGAVIQQAEMKEVANG